MNIYIVQDDTLNAAAAGGQNMFIHTGLIMEAETPEELKGVIGHETGHIALATTSRARPPTKAPATCR